MTDETTPPAVSGEAAVTETRGRPLKPISIDDVERLAGLGLTSQQIAHRLGCATSTLTARLSSNAAVRAAMDRGLAMAVERAASALDRAIQREDMESVRFFLKTKGGYKISEPKVVVMTPVGAAPTIDGHVLDLAARHTALLDSPDPDVIDAEFVEVEGDEPSAPGPEEPSAEELAALLE